MIARGGRRSFVRVRSSAGERAGGWRTVRRFALGVAVVWQSALCFDVPCQESPATSEAHVDRTPPGVLSPAECRLDLRSFREMVRRAWVFADDEERMRRLDKVVEDSISAVVGPTATCDFAVLIHKIVATLNDGHAKVHVPSANYATTAPLSFMAASRRLPFGVVDGREGVLVYDLARSVTGCKIPVGSRILAIDGEQVESRVKRIEPFVSASTSAARRYDALRYAVRSEARAMRVEAVTTIGERVSTMVLTVPVVEDETPVEWERLSGRVGYVAIHWFHEPFAEKMKDAIDEFRDCATLVLDLRGNGGGSFRAAHGLAAHMLGVGQRRLYGVSQRRNSLYYRQTGRIGWTEPERVWVTGAGASQFGGSVAVVTDAGTRSAAEGFAAFVLENFPRAVHIGQESAGSFAAIAQVGRLAHSQTLVWLSVARALDQKGGQREGCGLSPRVSIRPRMLDLARGEDPWRSAALSVGTAKD